MHAGYLTGVLKSPWFGIADYLPHHIQVSRTLYVPENHYIFLSFKFIDVSPKHPPNMRIFTEDDTTLLQLDKAHKAVWPIVSRSSEITVALRYVIIV